MEEVNQTRTNSSCRPFSPYQRNEASNGASNISPVYKRTCSGLVDRVCKYFYCHICDMTTWNAVWPKQGRALNLLIIAFLKICVLLQHFAVTYWLKFMTSHFNLPYHGIFKVVHHFEISLFRHIFYRITVCKNVGNTEPETVTVSPLSVVFPMALEGIGSGLIRTASTANTKTREPVLPNHPDAVIT